MSKRLSGLIGVRACLAVGVLAGCTGEVVTSEELDAVEQEIISGSTVAGSATRAYFWEPTMQIRNSVQNGNCSGVALRNDVILTARHCVTTTNDFAGVLVSPTSLLSVSHGTPTSGCNSTTCRTVSEILEGPVTQDVALLILAGPLRINGKTNGHSVGIDPLASSHFRTKLVGVTGYGVNNFSDSTGSTAGVLRSGTVTITSTFAAWKSNWNPGTRAMVSNGDSNGNGLPWDGDSGGPYWNQFSFNPATTPDSQIGGVIGVHSTSDFRDGKRVALSTPHAVFRDWVNDELTARTPTITDSMTSTAFFNQLEEREPNGIGSITPTWSVDANGLTEPSNYSTVAPDRVGTIMLHKTAIYEDFHMSVTVQGSDNDTVGIVFHYVDDSNYLRFSVDEQTRSARIVRFKPGQNAVVLSEATLPAGVIDLNHPTQLAVTVLGSSITAQVFSAGNASMSVSDQNIFVGRIGIMENAMSGNVHFSDWHSLPL